MACSSSSPTFIPLALPTGVFNLEIPDGVHPPPPSSLTLAGLLDVRPGEAVLDLGCGAGLLAIAAASRGASRVVATDTDERALDAAARNARACGMEDRILFRKGSWYEALQGCHPPFSGPFHVIVATPPQTPGPFPFGPRYGGRDGTDHLCAVIDGAASVLVPATGRLWLLAISLANPAKVLGHLSALFSTVRVVSETERFFLADEYEALAPGLMGHLLRQRSAGQTQFRETDDGRYVFQNLFFRASGGLPE